MVPKCIQSAASMKYRGAYGYLAVRLYRTKINKSEIDSIIRVNHAGELGADKIYEAQIAILGNTSIGPKLKHMWEAEKVHRATFEELIVKYRARPSALVPLWNIAGYLVGTSTALLGPKVAMACTVAVETVIVEHYNEQLRTLMADPENNKELLDTIKKFRDDEQEHHDTGIECGAEETPFYQLISNAIQFGSKCAVSVAKLI